MAHIWRIFEEGSQLATDPVFVILTITAAALSGWAWRLLSHVARSRDESIIA